MLGHSALLAGIAAELSGLVAKHHNALNNEQINAMKALVALLTGGTSALLTADVVGAGLTLPMIIRYLIGAGLPQEFAAILGTLQSVIMLAGFQEATA